MRKPKPGKFRLADKGTLLQDDIGDVPGAIQVKLLRVLQDREFERLGGTRTLKVDVRLVAATNRDLRAALEEGTFREDLYYRLNVVAIDIPSLREHKEDIPALANYFLERYAKESAKTITAITPEAMKRLMDYHWQETSASCRTSSNAASPFPLPHDRSTPSDIYLDDPAKRSSSSPGSSPYVLPSGVTLEQWEDETIREALRQADGNKSQAARALGLSRNAAPLSPLEAGRARSLRTRRGIRARCPSHCTRCRK